MPETRRALFVYNADGSLMAALSDYAHKVMSPQTYECRLCQVTYGLLGKKREWRRFLATLPIPVDFYHRNTFRRRHPDRASDVLPAVYVEEADGRLRQVIAADEINACPGLDELEDLVGSRLRAQS